MEGVHLAAQLPAPAGEQTNPSLVKEMGETLQEMLRHLTLAILLWLRLCMLPVAYTYHMLSTPNILWTRNPLSILIHLSRSIAGIVPQSVKEHHIVALGKSKFRIACNAALKICRIARTLYSLGELLDQNPDLLESRRSSSVQRSKADRCRDGSDKGSEVAHHATASQVYHAALARESNTLDDLLAGFSVSRDASQTDQDRRRNSSITRMECERCSQRVRYRNSSIQTTPERMFTPLNVLQENTTPRLQPSDPLSSASEIGGDHSLESTKDTPTTAGSGLPANLSQLPLASSAQLMPSSTDEELVLASSQSLPPQAEGCPREVARQAQSRIPRRRSSPPDIGSESATSVDKCQSMPTREPATPSRRGKLQRRMRTPRT